jgi:prevent-host-death family protein
METVGSFEAKTHLSRLLDRVEKGETFTITKNGRPVARLVPAEERTGRSVAGAIADLRALRRECFRLKSIPRDTGGPCTKCLRSPGRKA